MQIIYSNEDVHSKINKIILEGNEKKKQYDHQAQLTRQLNLKVVKSGTNPHDGVNVSSTSQWQTSYGAGWGGRGVDLSLVMITLTALTD